MNVIRHIIRTDVNYDIEHLFCMLDPIIGFYWLRDGYLGAYELRQIRWDSERAILYVNLVDVIRYCFSSPIPFPEEQWRWIMANPEAALLRYVLL